MAGRLRPPDHDVATVGGDVGRETTRALVDLDSARAQIDACRDRKLAITDEHIGDAVTVADHEVVGEGSVSCRLRG